MQVALRMAKESREETGASLTAALRDVPLFPFVFLVALVLSALFADGLAPHSPIDQNLRLRLLPPVWVEGGNANYLLGTDMFGRDLLSRIIHGSRISLTLSVLTIVLSGAVGTAVGLVAAYFGGLTDSILMRTTDIALSLPLPLMAVVMAVVLGSSFTNVFILLAFLLWPRYARQIRGEGLAIKSQDFVALARVAGCSPLRIMLKHILPNVVPTLLVVASLQVGYVIVLESSLSFLGVGLPPPMPAWGLMVAEGKAVIQSSWWLSVLPGIAILFTVLSLNLLGDWLRDRLDPKLRQV